MQYAVGTHVMTPRGSGVIEAYDGEKKLYLVRVGETSEEFPRKDILIEMGEFRKKTKRRLPRFLPRNQ